MSNSTDSTCKKFPEDDSTPLIITSEDQTVTPFQNGYTHENMNSPAEVDDNMNGPAEVDGNMNSPEEVSGNMNSPAEVDGNMNSPAEVDENSVYSNQITMRKKVHKRLRKFWSQKPLRPLSIVTEEPHGHYYLAQTYPSPSEILSTPSPSSSRGSPQSIQEKSREINNTLHLLTKLNTFYLNYSQPHENMYLDVLSENHSSAEAFLYVKLESDNPQLRRDEITDDSHSSDDSLYKNVDALMNFMVPTDSEQEGQELVLLFRSARARSRSKLFCKIFCGPFKLGQLTEMKVGKDQNSEYLCSKRFRIKMSLTFLDVLFDFVRQDKDEEDEDDTSTNTENGSGCCGFCQKSSGSVSKYNIYRVDLVAPPENETGFYWGNKQVGTITYGEQVQVQLNKVYFPTEEYNAFKAIILAASVTIYEQCFSKCSCSECFIEEEIRRPIYKRCTLI